MQRHVIAPLRDKPNGRLMAPPAAQAERPPTRSPHPLLALVAVAYVVSFLFYYFSLTLPNTHVPRHQVWLWALGLLPQLPPPLSEAFAELVRSPYLSQRLRPLLFGAAALMTLLAIGRLTYSALSRRLRWEQDHGLDILVHTYALGASLLSSLTLLLGLAGLLYPTLLRLGAAAAMAWGLWDTLGRRQRRPRIGIRGEDAAERSTWYVVAVVGSVALLLMIAGSLLPATDFDVREYHLQGPKEYFLAGRIRFLSHNVYTNMPFGTEMLTLFAMVLTGDWWWGALAGQFVLATFPLMTVLAAGMLARELLGPQAMPWAIVAAAGTPWFYRLGIIPYAEGGYCFYTLVAVAALARVLRVSLSRSDSQGDWYMAGWAAGSAFATKYTAVVFVVMPVFVALIVVAWARARLSWLGLALAAAAVAGGPWPLKNVFYTGNPVYPLAYELFDGRNWNEQKDRKWDAGHQTPGYRFGQLRANILDVAARSDWQSALIFALAPVAWLDPRRRSVAFVWLFVLYLFACWWALTHRIDRFWLPLEPLACVLAGGGAAALARLRWLRGPLLVLVAAISYFNLSLMASPLSGNNAYGMPLNPAARDPLNTATGQFVKYANLRLVPTARILAVGAADLFHLNRPYAYNTVFDDCLLELWLRGKGPRSVQTELKRRGFTHVFVCWEEIKRYRDTYGYTAFVNPGWFRRMRHAGVLELEYAFGEPMRLDGAQVPRGALYRVR